MIKEIQFVIHYIYRDILPNLLLERADQLLLIMVLENSHGEMQPPFWSFSTSCDKQNYFPRTYALHD